MERYFLRKNLVVLETKNIYFMSRSHVVLRIYSVRRIDPLHACNENNIFDIKCNIAHGRVGDQSHKIDQ